MNKDQLVKLWKEKMNKNFMTPDIIKFITWDNQIIEISQGKGIYGERIFGMTYGKFDPHLQKFEIDHKISRMFKDRTLLENVANMIKATDGCRIPKSPTEKYICNKLKEGHGLEMSPQEAMKFFKG